MRGDRLILGLEEAGRGPVIGPMIICGVAVREEDIKKLMEIGVKDSKLLTPEKRQALAPKIKAIAEKIEVIEVSAEEIDRREEDKLNLNELEAEKMAKIIDRIKPDKTIIDTPNTNIKMFRDYLKGKLKHECELVTEHKADVNYPVVSAASIIAKVIRDKRVKEIEWEIRIPIGSGYPSDPITQKFLEKYWTKLHKLPFIRNSWATIQQLKDKKGQKSVADFL